MVAFNFKARFADDVQSGRKTQTIRRTSRAQPGERVQLYTGQRTKACRKLVDPDPVCVQSTYIAIRPGGITLGDRTGWPEDIDEFARLDGFRDYADMHTWFAETYGETHFTGFITKWAPALSEPPHD